MTEDTFHPIYTLTSLTVQDTIYMPLVATGHAAFFDTLNVGTLTVKNVGGAHQQLLFNNSGAATGSTSMTFNPVTNTTTFFGSTN